MKYKVTLIAEIPDDEIIGFKENLAEFFSDMEVTDIVPYAEQTEVDEWLQVTE